MASVPRRVWCAAPVPRLIAYHVSERGEKKFWTRIRAARDHDEARGLIVELALLPEYTGSKRGRKRTLPALNPGHQVNF